MVCGKITRAYAKALYESGFWESMSDKERAMFQLFEDRLCMPFDVFHAAIEKALGRPVWTHEFALNRAGLQAELLGDAPRPTMDEIVGLIPAEKLIVCQGTSPT